MGIVAKGAWLAAAAALCVQPVRSQTPLRGTIEGDVVDVATGRGISNARVLIQFREDEPLVTSTDDHGHFQFSGLEFKPYRVDARFPGFMSPKEATAGYGGEMVYLAPARPNGQVRLEMQRYGAIVGKVVDALGIPVEGVTVDAVQRYTPGERRSWTLYNDGNDQYVGRQQSFTDDLGQYRLAPLAAGSYYLLVQPGSNYYAMQAEMGPPTDEKERGTFYPHALRPSEGKPVELAEGKELRLDLRILRRAGVKVSGRILGLRAAAQPGLYVSVFAWPLSPGTSHVFPALSGDRFSATDLLPGKYVFEAGQYATGDWNHQDTLAAARRIVEVGTEDVDGVDLTLVSTPDVEGMVVFENGCAAAPVWIQLQGDSRSGRFPLDLHVGADGRFVLRHLVPAKYDVYVRPEGVSNAVVRSAKLGDEELRVGRVMAGGLEVTAETRGPLRITMGCAGR